MLILRLNALKPVPYDDYRRISKYQSDQVPAPAQRLPWRAASSQPMCGEGRPNALQSAPIVDGVTGADVP
jgi:hypothetical protein